MWGHRDPGVSRRTGDQPLIFARNRRLITLVRPSSSRIIRYSDSPVSTRNQGVTGPNFSSRLGPSPSTRTRFQSTRTTRVARLTPNCGFGAGRSPSVTRFEDDVTARNSCARRSPQHRTDTDASASDRRGCQQPTIPSSGSSLVRPRPNGPHFRRTHALERYRPPPEGITSGRTTSRSVASTRHHPAHLPNRRPHASESHRPNSSRHVLFVQSVRFERPTTVRVETVLICRFRGVHPVDESEK